MLVDVNSDRDLNDFLDFINTQGDIKDFYSRVEYIEKLLDELKRDETTSPQLRSFGYWAKRVLNSTAVRSAASRFEGRKMRPLGTVVHFCAGNIPLNPLYSWFSSFLLGNSNIVRISTRSVASMNEFLRIYERYTHKCPQIFKRNFFCLINNENQAMLSKISSLADARMIWGGDDTVSKIRKLGTTLHCRDLVFINKYSLSYLRRLRPAEVESTARNFVRDAFPGEGFACFSPKVVLWSEVDPNVKIAFWAAVAEISSEFTIGESKIDQMKYICPLLLKYRDNIIASRSYGKLTVFDFRNSFFLDNMTFSSTTFFQSNVVDDLEMPLLRRLQTVTTNFDLDSNDVTEQKIFDNLNADRYTRIGYAGAFSITWDGYDLLNHLSKTVAFE